MRKKITFIFALGLAAFLTAAPVPKPVLSPLCLALVSPQNVDNYMEQGGARWAIGGSLDVESGGELDIETGGAFKLSGTAVTSSAAELNVLDAVTAGTVTASLALVVDDNKDIGDLRNLDAVNIDLGASGTAGSLDIFPGTESKGKLTIAAVDNTGDTAITITNAEHGQATEYTLPDIGQATGNFVVLKASQTTAGELKRADLTEDALQVYGIPLHSIRAADLTAMGVSETAGDHYLNLSSEVILLKGEASQNETEASVSYVQFVFPAEYVAAGDVKVRIKHKVSGTGTLGSCGIDVEAFEQDGNGAVGSDICATDAAASTAAWATTDFTITATDLVAGDIINIKIISSIEETGNSNPLEAHLDGIAVLLDIKG